VTRARGCEKRVYASLEISQWVVPAPAVVHVRSAQPNDVKIVGRVMKLDLPRTSDLDAGVWFSTPASTRYPTHWHDELELNLVLWGGVEYAMGSRTVKLGRGSLLLLAPGQQHTLLGVSDDLAMWVSAFRPCAVRDAEEVSGVSLLERLAWDVRQLGPDAVLELSALHARLSRCDDPYQLNSQSRHLLAHVSRYWHARQRVREAGASHEHRSWLLHAAVARARTLLREPEGAPSLSVLSRRCGLEAGRLSRLFKQQMGLSMVQFRSHFRVQYFIRRFGHGDRTTMLDAALASGFGSYAQFHRAFHQVTGYAPSEHLRRVRAGIVVPVEQGLQLLRAHE
jgi:AraC-like DNA-binding protein